MEREERFRVIYEDSNDAIMLLDESGFLDCNKRTLELFGLASKENFCQSTPVDLSPAYQPDGKDSKILSLEHIQKALATGFDSFEWVHHRQPSGENFYADVMFSTFSLRGKIVIQSTGRDIT